MRAYSNDLRYKIIKAIEAGEVGTHVAKRFDVAKSFVYKIYKRYKQTGSYEALRQPGVKPKLTNEEIEKLKILVSENPSATLDELRVLGNFMVCRTTNYNYNTLKKLKITYKKSPFRGRTKARRCRKSTGEVEARKS